MRNPSDSTHHVRRVVLPSGRSIEVVYFDSQPGSAPADVPATTREGDLHVCPECERDLVYPTEWEETSPTHWQVDLRCPNCEWGKVGEYDQNTVDVFDENLDRGTEALVGDLRRLTQANMEEEIDRFTAALAADAIWPMDF